MSEYYSVLYMCLFFFIHSSVSGHLGCVYVLGAVNSAALNIRVQASFEIMVLPVFIPRNGISGSYDNHMIFLVLLLPF